MAGTMRRAKGATYRALCTEASGLQSVLTPDFHPDGLLAPPARIVKQDVRVTAGITETAGRRVFVKRYTPNRRADALKLLARQQRGPRAFGLSLRLFTAGLPVPEPYGWLVERRRTGRRRSYYLCQALANCEDLRNMALARRGQSFPGAMDLARESAAILARLHASGYRHGDYKWANLMLEESSGRLWLIDLDSLRPMSAARSRAGRGRDLARFVLDGEELGQGRDVLAAFAESYAQACELTPEQVMAMAEGPLRMFRERHLKRYGEAGPYGPAAPVPADG